MLGADLLPPNACLAGLVVAHHVPHYNTLISHYIEGECLRKIYEPLYYKFGVDLVLTGHAHG
jgi:acid phosphatase type 7